MKIVLFGTEKEVEELHNKVKLSLDELWLGDFIKIDITTDESLKKELDIQKVPALIIEEESIDFKDIIFEGIVPDEWELKSMFVSIIGWSEPEWGCAPGGCGSGCSSC